MGPFGGAGVDLVGWGVYRGSFSDFLNSSSVRLSFAFGDVSVTFNGSGINGGSLDWGLGTTIGVALILGDTKGRLRPKLGRLPLPAVPTVFPGTVKWYFPLDCP
jgi:hypothetical protein